MAQTPIDIRRARIRFHASSMRGREGNIFTLITHHSFSIFEQNNSKLIHLLSTPIPSSPLQPSSTSLPRPTLQHGRIHRRNLDPRAQGSAPVLSRSKVQQHRLYIGQRRLDPGDRADGRGRRQGANCKLSFPALPTTHSRASREASLCLKLRPTRFS